MIGLGAIIAAALCGFRWKHPRIAIVLAIIGGVALYVGNGWLPQFMRRIISWVLNTASTLFGVTTGIVAGAAGIALLLCGLAIYELFSAVSKKKGGSVTPSPALHLPLAFIVPVVGAIAGGVFLQGIGLIQQATNSIG